MIKSNAEIMPRGNRSKTISVVSRNFSYDTTPFDLPERYYVYEIQCICHVVEPFSYYKGKSQLN